MTVATAARPMKKAKPATPSPASPGIPSPSAIRATAERFKMLSDPTRLRLLLTLAGGERHVGALCDAIGQTYPTCSHHISLMRASGLIESRRNGQQNVYSLTASGRMAVAAAGAMG